MAVLRRPAALLALVLVVAACGGDGSDADDGSNPTTTTTSATEATTTTTSAIESGGDVVAQEGDSVAVHYIGTLDDGTEFDASRPRGATLDFVIGSGQMIPGFDQGVRGMAVGEVKTIRIDPADAYGEVDPELIIEVDVSQIPEGTAAGDVLIDQGTGQQVRVISIVDGKATLDLNARLAGEALTFEIEMMAINP